MKRIFKYLTMTVLSASLFFYSCETTELEDLASPNALSADLADADLLLNQVQLNYLGAMQNMQGTSSDLARLTSMFGRNYYQNFSSGTASSMWSNLYSGMLPDIEAIELQNGEDNIYGYHLGISKTMVAHIMMLLVDSVGDVPWSQANQPTAYPSPMVDDDADVYAAAFALLDEAESYLQSSGGGDDLFYGGDAGQWIKVINTLRMRYHLTVGNYAEALAMDNIIATEADDLQFNYGTQDLQPNTRHPFYNSDYTDGGAAYYQSSWLMDLMVGDKTEWYGGAGLAYPGLGNEENGAAQAAITTDDPRRRYMFYRQQWVTPGQSAMLFAFDAGPWVWPLSWGGSSVDTENAVTLTCSTTNQPFHLEFTPDGDPTGSDAGMKGRWCATFLGYWGRHHGDDGGTPPDQFARTAFGVYPAGGSFDNQPDIPNWDNFGGLGAMGDGIKGAVGLGNGGQGAGIWPIHLASYSHFMKAEAAMWLGDAATAATLMEAGMNLSFQKVMSFGVIDPEADSNYFPSATEVSDFIQLKMGEFNAAPLTSQLDALGWPVEKDKLDILGEQYFVAMFGGANDAWNFIRRTGYPRTLSRGLMDNVESGPFPRTGTYPTGEISANPNILQRQDNTTQVFWDNGATNPAN
jgi:hypothetical protein